MSGSHEDVRRFLARERDQHRELARVEAFSDAVYAIAITLLTLELVIPEGNVDVWAEIGHLLPRLLSFTISFAVIGSYWVAHHRLYSFIERYTTRLLWLNLLNLFFIVLLPFTTSVVGAHGGTGPSSGAAVTVYALSIAAGGLTSAGLATYALRTHRLCAPDVPDALIRYLTVRGVVVAATFVVSLALLPLGAPVVELSWLSLLVILRLLRLRLIGRTSV